MNSYISLNLFIAGNTTNLQFHLDHEHSDLSTKSSAEGSGSQKKIQLKLDQHKTFPVGRLSTKRQNDLTEALMKLVVSKVLPLSLVENKEFRTFVEMLEPRLVNLR